MARQFNTEDFSKKLFNVQEEEEFNHLCLDLFDYQLAENQTYAEYVNYLGKDGVKLANYSQIPFLPIDFFKSRRIVSGQFQEEMVFSSSGTSGMQRSKHIVRSLELYKTSFMKCFSQFYRSPSEMRILGLLPSYLEREGSSLVYMVEQMIKSGGHPESGFYLDEFAALADQLKIIKSRNLPALLIGVSFGLLDFAEQYQLSLGENTIVMETGGMKGRREELTREELHNRLSRAFRQRSIHSEYGMTELLSQAYSRADGRFFTPPWMRVLIRDIQDPFTLLPAGETGAINIIDLANLHSCAFIETQDIGRIHPDGSFEVLGRTDASDIRGCSLLMA